LADGDAYYLDGLKVNGKRKRLFFTTEAEAKEELKKWDRRISPTSSSAWGASLPTFQTERSSEHSSNTQIGNRAVCH
jgi:hypothetical protein